MMISIIVCSTKSAEDCSYVKNIEDTIGNVDYELIWIDNSESTYSIFEAYNKGVQLSKGDYLCFAHEDIFYRSNSWGEIVVDAFARDFNVGMLGLVGGHVLTRISTCWWSTDRLRGVLWQGTVENGTYKSHLARWTKQDDTDKYAVSVDGVWMVIRKSLFSRIKFDSDTYSGFHFYDMDISMQVNCSGYKILIIDGVEVEHKSAGRVNASFYRNCIAFHKKWDKMLPIYSSLPSANDQRLFDISRVKQLLYHRVYFPLCAYFFRPTRRLVYFAASLLSHFK